jgi:hypothetical protein
VFLEDFAGIAEEMGQIAEIETDILMDTGAVMNALPLRAGVSGANRADGRTAPRRPRPVTPEAAD